MIAVATASPADDFPNSNELLIDAKEAAKRLKIGSRSLWSLTNQRQIPSIRIGRSVRYPVDGLRDWIRDRLRSRPHGGASRA